MFILSRFLKTSLLIAAFAVIAQSASAQRAGGGPGDHNGNNGNPSADVLREIMDRLGRLESKLYDLDHRVERLEHNDNNYPPAPRPASYSCLLTDSGYSKVFLGKAQSRLQAETIAKQECGKSVNSMYCNATARCSDGNYDPRVKGYFCQIVDSGYSRVFSSEGTDIIEAEAKAKQACQSSLNAMYCGNVTARCEAIRQ